MIRRAGLLVVSVAVAHQAIYQLGAAGHIGDERAHGYWPLMVLLAAAACVALTSWAVMRTARAAHGRLDKDPESASYIREAGRIFISIAPTVAGLYLLLENAEHILSQGHAPGLSVYMTASTAAALPILLVVVFLIAALGAAVRLEVAAIARAAHERSANASLRRRRSSPQPVWSESAVQTLYRLLSARRDLGRAPPSGA